jgi:capsular exopolysaccharide synthesis family protein
MSRIFDALQQYENDSGQSLSPELSLPESVSPAAPAQDQISTSALTSGTGEAIGGDSVTCMTGRERYRKVRITPTPGSALIAPDMGSTIVSEQYRVLRTNLLQHPQKPKCIAVTSTGPKDGKTTTTLNLSVVLAMRDSCKVLVVDGDLRQYSLAAALGIEARPGLAEVLRGRCRPGDAIVSAEHLPNLFILPAGEATMNPAELFDSDLWRSIAAALRESFSFVVIDTTPMDTIADFQLILEACDGYVVVVRPGHSSRSAFAKAMKAKTAPKFLGSIINDYNNWFLWRGQNHYSAYSGGAGTTTRRWPWKRSLK